MNKLFFFKKYRLKLYLLIILFLSYPFSLYVLKLKILFNLKISKSQIFQDILALYYSKFKKKGFFIEVGAGDGFHLSNTYLLEKKYNWNGLLVEPSKQSFGDQKKFRKCKRINTAVYKINSIKNFYERDDIYLSSINNKFKFKRRYKLKFMKMNTILKKKRIQKNIDYLSIDTEGNELDVLQTINFNYYKIKFISVEHNFNILKRKKIINFLKKKGYMRVLKKISYMDDFFIIRN